MCGEVQTSKIKIFKSRYSEGTLWCVILRLTSIQSARNQRAQQESPVFCLYICQYCIREWRGILEQQLSKPLLI